MRLCFIVERVYRQDGMPLRVAEQLLDWGHEVDLLEPDATVAGLGEPAGRPYDAWVLKTVSEGPGLSLLEAAAATGVATINDVRAIRRVRDKAVAAAWARVHGLPSPTTWFVTHRRLLEQIPQSEYPLVVKPTTKRYTAIRVRESSELPSALPDNGAVLVQPFLESPLRGVVGAMWRGRLLGAAHLRYLRLWPLPCGTVAAAETVSPDLALEEQLRVLLASHEGLFHVDLAGRHLLDVNLRAHATLPLAAVGQLGHVGGDACGKVVITRRARTTGRCDGLLSA